jgi:hypothetical protein
MDPRAIAQFAEALKKGAVPDAQAWDIAAAVRLIADSLGRPDAGVGADVVGLAARALNRERHYEHTRLLCEAWQGCRGFEATIRRHHVQALINLSALDAAEARLHDGLARIGALGPSAQAAAEKLEYEGLQGRIDKQRFVATGNPDFLAKATDQYFAQYDGSPAKPYWHGINAVALRAREERASLPRTDMPASTDLAKTVQKQAEQRYRSDPNDAWLPATLSEAALAQGRCEQAELWLYRLLHHRTVDPFTVESYDRQLREIWQGSATGGGANCADRLVAIIAGHLARTQRRWSVSAADVPALKQALEADPSGLEKNFSGEGSFSVAMVKRMLDACASIGCVCNTAGERLGTGFLVDGAWFGSAFDPGPVFVTNAHVVSESVVNAIRVRDVRVTFEVESATAGGPVFYKASDVLFTAAPGDLGDRVGARQNMDVTIVRLEGLPARFAGLSATHVLPLVEPRAKAYVVGHPRGSGLQITLHDSLLLDIDDDERLVHYRTPTDPGSSGSPVFNADWEVMAVHHGGSAATPRLHGEGRYEANEGIALAAIRQVLIQ